MTDTIEQLGQSTIQHGPENDRIYLMKLAEVDLPELPGKLIDLAGEKGYSKVFAKAPATAGDAFAEAGFVTEATVPGFYHGRTDGLFLAKFLSEDRADEADPERTQNVIEAAKDKLDQWDHPALPDGYALRSCTPDDTETMARLYKKVFATYPFPIDDPAYLKETMATHVDYFGVWKDGRLVALSSAEKYPESGNVEMTDFATDPDERGASLACYLLVAMDQAMAEQGIPTGYTIARSPSFGMNITFAKCGYRFAGTLVNNTNISGGFESMNVWYKPLT